MSANGNKQQLERLVFDQNLDEVHLLVDFVSGRADRSLASLTIPSPDDPTIPMSSRQIIEKIAEMRYPPNGSDAANADNAAILLLAKDRLSALASPARGLTIAYTAMFIDAEVKTWPVRLWDKLSSTLRRNTRRAEIGSNEDAMGQDTRLDLAARAFPMLRPHARRFRRWRDGLATFAVLWLVLTAVAYWDAGLGRAALERLDLNWKTFTDELRDTPVLLNCETRTRSDAGAPGDVQFAEDAARAELACRRHDYHRWMGETAVTEVRGVFGCEGMAPLTQLLHVWCWHWLLSGSHPAQASSSPSASAPQQATEPTQAAPTPRGPSPEIKDNATYWQTATSILSVFTTYILPMMFALLGTLIGAFRAILNRVRDSELAPRDFVRMMLGIPTGLVAGIAVGLFLSPTSVPIQGSGIGVGGQLTLTASGLGFLAGYASQSFFTYLDTIIGTVFPAGAQNAATPGQRRTTVTVTGAGD
ncbi:MAG: hypothetical protein JO008_16255 [Alphaproteobacteria bacterium]|nr:hypothetical protein [Alphaproteobacteria bacterium]